MSVHANRRRYERLSVPPMYTPVAVRPVLESGPASDGHTYDLSEGGLQFELDHAICPGTPVIVKMELPRSFGADAEADRRDVVAFGNVVWADDSEPGPVRMAVVFTKFASEGDRQRLLERIRRVAKSRAAA